MKFTSEQKLTLRDYQFKIQSRRIKLTDYVTEANKEIQRAENEINGLNAEFVKIIHEFAQSLGAKETDEIDLDTLKFKPPAPKPSKKPTLLK